jgi:Arc/MetJ-type ribon-helix-helix transcriptional regulator
MKHKTSVAFDKKTIEGIRYLIRSGNFRNKSHVVEFAVKKLLEGSKE